MAVASNLKEEDAESLYRGLRKGKVLSEDYPDDSVPSFRPIPEDKMRRPLTTQSSHPDKKLGALNIHSPDPGLRVEPAMSIPPPPSKHVERERILDNGGHGKRAVPLADSCFTTGKM